jgi:hypothetical protein
MLNTAWRGISTPRPAPLSEACLPELFSVSRGVRGVHPKEVWPFFSDDHGTCGALCLCALRLCMSHCERASV